MRVHDEIIGPQKTEVCGSETESGGAINGLALLSVGRAIEEELGEV
jgi:hypothetical protein